MKRLAIIAACLLVLAGCKSNGTTPEPVAADVDYTQVAVPAFDADSAYGFVAAQLAFGNRTPGSKGWELCAAWLERQMGRWCDTVMVQPFKATLWNGQTVPGRNIIGSLNPMAPKRVLLAAHWDSRLWADHDPDASLQHQPLLGANDGASGVAVLMETARAMQQQRPEIGVDIIFFDLEDQGTPEWAERYEDDTWCKGAQHWSRNPHQPFYQARYGILLDMVGVEQPRFTKEQFSMQYASTITNKVWAIASAIGYGGIFEDTKTDPILDDHLYINTLRGIPTADIVQHSHRISFFSHWHTTTDDLKSVSPQTLKIVGDVVLTTVYSTK